MSRPAQIALLFWGATALSTAAPVLLIMNMVVGSANRSRQVEISQRAQTISEVAQRSRNVPLIRDLVIAAQKEPNAKIRALLTKYGIVFAPAMPVPERDPRLVGPPDDDQPAALSTWTPTRRP
jgi:hypothetical protein